jgi:hypothetical protein
MMKTISLYSILFEADDSNSIIDPKDMEDVVKKAVGEETKKITDLLVKTQQGTQVPTASLSTTGAKPAVGSKESGSDKKLDQIAQAQTAETTANKDLQKDLENIQSQVSTLTAMAKEVQKKG